MSTISHANPSTLITAFNLRAPNAGDVIVDAKGQPSVLEQKWRATLIAYLQSTATINLNAFCRIDGHTDDTAGLQSAINQAIKQGGGVVVHTGGILSTNTVFIPVNAPPITIVGDSSQTCIFKRHSPLAPKVGIFDVSSSNYSMMNIQIDGGTTVPVGLAYNAGFTGIGPNDPMAASLTTNTSVWIHGKGSNFYFFQCVFTHAGGYSILIDAISGDVNDVDISSCWFVNNRPTLFGVNSSTLTYGSWNGGIYANGDGRSSTSGVVNRLKVTDCRFERNTGNCLWSHLYGLTRLHSDFRFISNSFLDCGLDGVLCGGITGGVVSNNSFRRVGYVTLDDTSRSIPKWLPGVPATALDSSGIVKGLPYESNSFCSINGGILDLDGHGLSSISGNVCRLPFPDEPEYAEDQIAITGPTNNGSASYGVNLGNTNQTAEGAFGVEIVGNSFINLPGGSIRMYGARFCHAQGNLVYVPAAPVALPIAMGPIGTGVNQRCHDNRVSHNHCQYSPSTSQPLVKEDDSITVFFNSEKNYVFGNQPIIGNGNAVEFANSPNSGSHVYGATVWF